MLGKIVSQEEFDSFYKSAQLGVLYFGEKRIILPEEFFTKTKPSLHWKELARIRNSSHSLDGSCVVKSEKSGKFDGLLDDLLQELTNQNLMTKNYLQKGDFLINGGGIGINPGKYLHTSVVYYPRVEEDAIKYGKHFVGRLFHISKVIIDEEESKNFLGRTEKQKSSKT